ncbi:hypothetical protein ABZP36_007503 [Zizania latifolia]
MDRRAHVSHLSVAIAVAVMAAVAVAAAAADVKAESTTVAVGTTTSAALVAVHRRVLSGSIQNSVLNPNRPACLQTCTGAGQPYTGRGCKNAYQCSG